MKKAVSAATVQQQLGRFLHEVDRNGAQVVIEQGGKPMAVMISYRQYNAWLQARDAAFARMDAVAARVSAELAEAGLTPEDLQQAIDDAAARVRRGD